MIEISLRPEVLFSVFSIQVTNTMVTTLLVTLLLSTVAFKFYVLSRKQANTFFVMSVRVLCYELLKFTDKITQNRSLSKRVLPLLLTFFLFITSANLISLIPGFLGSFYTVVDGKQIPLLRSPNSDLTTTMALAIVSVAFIEFIAVKELGLGGYLKRFFNFTSPVAFVVGFFELISEGMKLFSFAFRLFGNIFAGEVLLLVVGFLVPYFLPVPFLVMEMFVGLIQAFVFTILTLVFIKTAIIKHTTIEVS